MTRSASEIVGIYLSRLRAELAAAGAEDTDDLVAEIRSVLTDAAGDDAEAASAETARLGEPAELARGILAERGLDSSAAVSQGTWWRLGLAAPIDIAIGLAPVLVAALPLYTMIRFGQPRVASIAIALALSLAVLAWPFFLWRPWRRGGGALSPGMTLTGLAVVRAPGFWRLARIDELGAMGLAPRRRVTVAAVVALVGFGLLGGIALAGFDAGDSWLASTALSVGGSESQPAQFQVLAEELYGGLLMTPESGTGPTSSYVASQGEIDLRPLWERINDLDIRSVRVGVPERIVAGLYRLEVEEFGGETPAPSARVGSSTLTVGRRQWLSADGVGSDWTVVDIEVGVAPGSE